MKSIFHGKQEKLKPYAEAFLRKSFGVFFLLAGIGHLINFQMTVNGAGILWTEDDMFRKILAWCAVTALNLGGMSLFFGYKTRVGAFLVAVFLLPATHLHSVVMEIAQNSAASLNISSTDRAQQILQTLTNIAVQGHQANVMKNLMLLCVAFYFVLVGAGPFSMDQKRLKKQ